MADNNTDNNNDETETETADIAVSLAGVEKTLESVEIDNIWRKVNWRSPQMLRQRGEELCEQIAVEGLIDPLVIAKRVGPNGAEFRIAQGHSRVEGLLRLRDQNPELFEEMFGNGVPCTLYHNISDAQLARLAQDNANTVGMKTRLDVLLAGNMMFSDGAKEADVARALHKVLDLVQTGKETANRKKIQALNTTIKENREALASLPSGTTAYKVISANIEESIKERDEIIVEYRRGATNKLQSFWTAGDRAVWCAHQKQYGERHPDAPADMLLPVLRNQDVTSLAQAVKKDFGTTVTKKGKETIKPYHGVINAEQRESVEEGAFFQEAWAKIVTDYEARVADKGKKEKNDTPRPKAMAAKVIKEQQERLRSDGMRLLSQTHIDEKSLTDSTRKELQEKDEMLRDLERVVKYRTKWYREVYLPMVEEIKQEIKSGSTQKAETVTKQPAKKTRKGKAKAK